MLPFCQAIYGAKHLPSIKKLQTQQCVRLGAA